MENLAPDGPEPTTNVDRQRITSAKPTKYKDIKITNKMRVISKRRSTNKVSERFYKRYYSKQVSVQEFAPKPFEPKRIDALFGDAFND